MQELRTQNEKFKNANFINSERTQMEEFFFIRNSRISQAIRVLSPASQESKRVSSLRMCGFEIYNLKREDDRP